MPVYVALEGTEGCGKSTQARLLATSLGATLTRETGGTPVGERLPQILHDVEVVDLDARAEALMIAADRAEHVRRVVLPALDAGTDVISDRSVHSSLAYQGFGRGVELDTLRQINDWAIRGRWPDLAILLDVPDDVVGERLAERETLQGLDRFEREDGAFHDRVRKGFRAMAEEDGEHWAVIDASGTVESVAEAVRTAVRERLGR